MPTDPDTQHALFVEAVQLLGGARSTARAIDINERTMHRLIAGDMSLHDGFLRDIAAALAAHSAKCRELEKRLNPPFGGNLVDGQPREDGRRAGAQLRRKSEG